MQVLDLFSGIGGFSLGLERAGMTTVAFCEIDAKARKVLQKHWPHVPIFTDVKTLSAEALRERGISVDVICGGFPCQDISVAGKGAGIEGERSGLWSEFARLIGELRPRYAIVENVSALLNRGLDRVLGDLSEVGYDAEWHCIPAAAVGAPHRRDRIWIVAYPRDEGVWSCGGRDGVQSDQKNPKWRNDEGRGGTDVVLAEPREPSHLEKDVAHPERTGDGWRGLQRPTENHQEMATGPAEKFVGSSEVVAHANSSEREAWRVESGRDEAGRKGNRGVARDGAYVSDSHRERLQRQRQLSCRISEELNNFGDASWWEVEPAVGRVAHGLPGRVDRLKQLGNAVVPQIPELIGRAIMSC